MQFKKLSLALALYLQAFRMALTLERVKYWLSMQKEDTNMYLKIVSKNK